MNTLLFVFAALLTVNAISCNETNDYAAEFQDETILEKINRLRLSAKTLMTMIESIKSDMHDVVNQIDVKDAEEVVELRRQLAEAPVDKCYSLFNNGLIELNHHVREEALSSIFDQVIRHEKILHLQVLPFCDNREREYSDMSSEQFLKVVTHPSNTDYSNVVAVAQAHEGYMGSTEIELQYLLEIDTTPSPSAKLTKQIDTILREPLRECMRR